MLIRQIFELLVKIRVDSKYRMGVQRLNKYSPFTYVDRSGFGAPLSPNSSTEDAKLKDDTMVPTNHMSLAAACKIVIIALREELGKA